MLKCNINYTTITASLPNNKFFYGKYITILFFQWLSSANQ